MQQVEGVIGDLVDRKVEACLACENVLVMQIEEVEDVVERGRHVDAEVVQAEDVALQVEEHLFAEPALKECLDVVDGEDHLLVQFNRNLECHGVDDPHEGWLTGLIESQIVVRKVHSLQHSLVHTLGLDGELEDGEDCLLAQLVRDAITKVLLQIVDWVVV